jgi:hypothetical protein
MDDAEYRRLCAAPDVMKRATLQATVARLRRRDPELADIVARVMTGQTVPRPTLHAGTRDDDFLYLDLEPGEIEAIHDALIDEEVEHAQKETLLGDSMAGYVSGLADVWRHAESVRPQAN